jgi:hypothetical protein
MGPRRVIFLAPSPSKEDGKKCAAMAPFYDEPTIFDDEPTMQGEEPPQREVWQRRNRRRNVQRHHEAGERDPVQPVSRDEASEVGETPDERVHRKDGILAALTVDKLRTESGSKPSKAQGCTGRTISLLETCTPTSLTQ